jgi:hypothetical protein
VKKSATVEKFTLDSLQLYNVWSFQNRDNIIYKLSLLGWAQEEIGDVVGLDQSAITKIMKNINFDNFHNEYNDGNFSFGCENFHFR